VWVWGVGVEAVTEWTAFAPESFGELLSY
jgi:hypothetical protein